jgi:glucose/arabinose dehydrogenase
MGSVRNALLTFLSAATAAACGGGGGGSGSPPPPPPGNQAPSFTSSATASVSENTPAAFYIAAATDPESAALTYSVSGGADAARFTFNPATRELRFSSPPDFETPSDANTDNVYEIRLSVSDGSLTASLDLRVTVTNQTDGFTVRRVATGLDSPIFLTGLPDGSGRVVVVERAGRLRVMNPTTGVIEATNMLDIASEISTDGEQGLLAVAFSPNFATDRAFYLHMNNTAGDTEIRRYQTVNGNPALADTSTGDIILVVDQPTGVTNHKGGMLAFNNDGHLLVSLGDGGGGGDPDGNAQNQTTLLGKLLRLDVSSDDYPGDANRDYAIPAGNAGAGYAPEIWALGLRNPFRGSVDPVTGDVFIGDVGQGAIEEVDRIVAGTPGPINFGWNLREGTQPYNGGGNSPSFTNPVTEYTRGSGPLQGQSITGGVVYRGPVTSLQGQYIFADFITNNIWSVPITSLTPGSTFASSGFTIRTQDFIPDAGTVNSIVAFGTDTANNVYIVDIGGEIFRIEPQS